MNQKAIIILVAQIDLLMDQQLKLIVQHQCLQRLESSWRGLFYLINQPSANKNINKIKIKLLDFAWDELIKDTSCAMSFEQTEIFNKIYHHEFDHPGGEPYGLLIGDYYLASSANQMSFDEEIKALQVLAKIGACAFVPFVTSISAAFFEVDDFTALYSASSLTKIFQQNKYAKWNQLRKTEEARFIGVVLPRVLIKPKFLWCNAIYSFAAVVMRAFSACAWMADIQGVKRNQLSGGLVDDLMPHFLIDKSELMLSHATKACITDKQEKIFSEFGFMALTKCNYAALHAFYNCCSIYNSAAGNDLSSSGKLNYILCVSRFVHYIKVLMRDKIGSFISTQECETYLTKWLMQYTANGEDLTDELKAKYPLSEAKVIIESKTYHTGCYLCIIYLRAHYQFECVSATLKLITEVAVT